MPGMTDIVVRDDHYVGSIQYPPIPCSRAPEAIRLGRYYDPYNDYPFKLTYNGEKGIVVFGINGQGKGTRIIAPNCLQMGGQRSLL